MQQTFTIPTNCDKDTLDIKSPFGPVYCFTADGRKISLAEEDTLFGKSFYLPAGIDDITCLEFVEGGGSSGNTMRGGGGGSGPSQIVSGEGGSWGVMDASGNSVASGGGIGGRAPDGRPSGGDGGAKGQPGKPGR